MIRLGRLSELAAVLAAEQIGDDLEPCSVSIDTRTLEPGALYVALAGERFDGHQFLQQAQQQGASAAVTERTMESSLPQLVVGDSRKALGQLGQHNRRQYQGPLVAITGSSGKTTVKEMLAVILGQLGPVLATRGNLNNDIGVPLTLLEIGAQHQFAVIEMGANHAGEIAYTAALAEPQVAVLTNAMGAHLEGFGSLEGVVKAKGEIFSGLGADGTAVINADDPSAAYWRDLVKERRVISFSRCSPHADLFASHVELRSDGCYSFVLNDHQSQVLVSLSVMGIHNIANALAAAAAAVALGLSLERIAEGLATCNAVAGRMQPHPCKRGAGLIVNDAYNANPGAVKAAVDALVALAGKRLLVLGDMAELGSEANALHAEVGRYAAEAGVDALLATGALSAAAVDAYQQAGGTEGQWYEDKQALVASLIDRLRAFGNEEFVCLVKGSRSAYMDEVIGALQSEDMI